jgi:predicted deacylase
MNPVIETNFPDLTEWACGNTGTPYAWTFDAALTGPHVCVNALVHGNEVCGAIAGDWLLRELRSGLQPIRGRLSIVFANVEAYRSFDRNKPYESRCIEEDFNRLWDVTTLDSARNSVELTRARQLRPFYDTVDHLLDLHSMLEPAPAISLAGDTLKGLALARSVGIPEHILVDSGHAAGKRLRDYAGFGDPQSSRSALLVECGQHWQGSVGDVAKQVLLRFLRHLSMVDAEWLDERIDPTSPAVQRVVDISTVVTRSSETFRWIRPVRGLEAISAADTLIALDGAREIRTPHADAVMVMPVPQPKIGQTIVRIGRLRAA